jgi:DNA-binding CsgD family transcriptional regulator
VANSSCLRIHEVRALLRVVGECRDLGDDRIAWRSHLATELAKLTSADLAMSGEMADCRALRPRDLGSVEWGWENGFDRAVFVEQMSRMHADPTYSQALNLYFSRLPENDGICLTRRDLISDQEWYRSHDYQSISSAIGIDHTLWCFRSIPRNAADENAGVVLCRASGRRDFSPRDRLIVHEAQAAIAPLVGGALASFDDPSPRALAPRVRQVLVCLLGGDGDKQIAARLRLSVHTINEYTKVLYRHFSVNGRSELLSRWIRRGWGTGFSWLGEP